MEWLKKALEINPHFRDARNFESLILKEAQAQGSEKGIAREGDASEAPDDPDAALRKKRLEAGDDVAPAKTPPKR
jgi:hypothetical protein